MFKKLFFLMFSAGAIFLCISKTAKPQAAIPASTQASTRTYVGSKACSTCHADIYARWSKTRMANVVVDPKQRPEQVIPDFTKADPLLTFKLDDVSLVYGSKWKQRYFKKVGNDYFPLPAQWDVTHKIWRAYFVQPNTDWWVPYYEADNNKRPTGPLCDGCHSVNYDIKTQTVTEWNVGCERCHGPGSEHIVPLSPPRPASSIRQSWILFAPMTRAFSVTRRDNR